MTEQEKKRFCDWLCEHPDATLADAVQQAGNTASPMEITANFLAVNAIEGKSREDLKQVFNRAFDDVIHGQALLDLMCTLVRLYREREAAGDAA